MKIRWILVVALLALFVTVLWNECSEVRECSPEVLGPVLGAARDWAPGRPVPLLEGSTVGWTVQGRQVPVYAVKEVPMAEELTVRPSYEERKVTIYSGGKVVAVFPGEADRELDLGLQAMAFARDERTQAVVFGQISRRALVLYRRLSLTGV